MPSYSDWISTKRSVYTLAMTRAYNARGEDPNSNELAAAWLSLNSDSSTQPLLPPATNFFGETPTASESDIESLETFLNANIDVAGKLNLRSTILADNDLTRKGLGGKGTVGTEKRRWKGQPLYTFANGVLVGKDSKLIAAIGTEGGEDIPGFGDDTLIYFDGIAGSKGSGIPGTTVFKGDVVVSGSIQGSGGVVIIDDVIQLEQGVDSPAGIGVDPSGKIRLRHRGEGFLDLIEESERIAQEESNRSLIEAKVWMGHQNTSSARWGSSLIPNSNFSMLTSIEQNGIYSEKISGVLTVGSTTSVQIAEDPHDGILRFDASNGVGIALPAIQITGAKYFIRIRYKGDPADPINTADTSEGLFIELHESTSEDIGDKSHVYDARGSYPGSLTEDLTWHQADSRKFPDSLVTTDSTAVDGLSIPATYSTESYVYEPTDGTNTASLVIRTRDYSGTISVDYVVMSEGVPTPAEVAELISAADLDIETEDTSSLVVGSQMSDSTLFQAIGGATLEDVVDGGDNNTSSNPDAAVRVTISSSGDGLLTKAISEGADRFLVGVRIKATSGTPNLSITAVETTLLQVPGLGSDPEFIALGSSNTRNVSIQLVEIDDATMLEKESGSIQLDSSYTTYLGTYDKTIINPNGTIADFDGTTLEDDISTPYMFSLAITADASCELLIDYIYCKEQAVSLNIARSLADAAVGDSATFVTTINNLLVKESGSLITNASMAMPGIGGLPAGYRARTGSTLELITSEDATGTITDRALSVSAISGIRSIISPPFSLGSADRYSIGASVKSNSGSGNIQIKIAYLSESIASDKITIGDSSSSSDVQTTNVSIDTSFEVANEAGDTGTSVSVTGNFENIIGTWEELPGQRFGSIIIEADTDFTVDYILVKAQSCSFDLAKSTAEDKRDEAIAMATGALQGLSNALNQEQGSLLGNPTFSHWEYESSSNPIGWVTGYQKPKAWAVTRSNNSTLFRVVATTESNDDADGNPIPVPGESVDATLGVLGGGAVFSHGGSGTGGILSSYFTIPSVPGLNDQTVGDDTYSPNGSYIVSIKLKSITGLTHTTGLRILAHEMVESPANQFSICTSSSGTDFDTIALESSYSSIFTGDSYTEDGTDYFTQRIQLINATDTRDAVVGTGTDKYIEQWSDGSFHIIAGSYTPSENVRYVCFEFIFESNVATQKHAIDYVSMMPQSIDGNFADTIASARAEGAIETLESEPSQTGQLLANPFFTSGAKRRAGGYPKKWIPYGSNPPFDVLSFTNDTLKRGLTLSGANTANAGIFSMPFRTSSDDYEIKVRAKKDPGDNAELIVRVYEYDSDIESGTEAIVSSTGHIPSSVSSSVEVANVGTGYKVLSTIDTNDSSPALSDSFETYSFDYVPSDTCRYASVLVRFQYIDSDKAVVISSVTCAVDNTASGNRLFGPFRNQSANGVFDTGYTGRNNTISTMLPRALIGLGSASSTPSGPNPEYFHLSREWRFKSTSAFTYSINLGFGTQNFQIPDTLTFQNNQGSFQADWTSVGYLRGTGTNSLINFTGQHRCDSEDINSRESIGLIVVSTGKYNNLIELDKPTINESLPIVTLSSKRNQKSCFGVLSDEEDRNGGPREYSHGNFVSVYHDEEEINRAIINSLGEGAIWICNINGNLENGDYITTCEIPGHGMRQDDDLLHNYTVAKITQDCNFELNNSNYDCVEFEYNGNIYRKAFVGCTYHCG